MVPEKKESVQGRFTGCQVAALVGGVLIIAGVCVFLGLVLGGVAGYMVGRSRAASPPPIVPTVPPHPTFPAQPLPAEERPYLGIRYRLLDRGARIERVVPGSPAAEAGLKPGDVILEVDGMPVGSEEGMPLNVLILSYRPGDRVRLRIERGGEIEQIEVELGRWSDREP